MDKKSVFIGGCDRSGTTMLGSMLGASEGCVVTPESFFKTAICSDRNISMNFRCAKNVLKKIESDFRFKLWESPLPDLNLFRHKDFIEFREIIYGIVQEYAKKVGLDDWSIWIDHTPTNLSQRHLIKRIFKDSKFIHIVRDGRAVAASIMPLNWGPNTPYYTAKWWAEKICPGLAAEIGFSNDVYRVKYEDVVLYPEETLKKLCRFTDIPYQPEMIDGRGFVVPEYTKTQHSLIGKKPDKNRINLWRKVLKPRDIEIFESLVGGILKSLGYSLVNEAPSPMTKRDFWRSRTVELANVTINKFAYKTKIKSSILKISDYRLH